MKVFYILPHCSTGGMPQYVLKQTQILGKDNDITVFEVHNVTNDFVVQRNQIQKLVQLNSNQDLLLKHIEDAKPDILHFQEVPETFMDDRILSKIYDTNRSYDIVVTAHGSDKGRHNFKYIPDQIVAVSNWQKAKFEKEFSQVDIDLWEYPIEDYWKYYNDKAKLAEKLEARQELGFPEIKGKHVLNVGLFTPGKNQGELFEIARENPDNLYHFVGNLAPNFESYWRPLMLIKPKNCIIWKERSDVERFYIAADELYFTSRLELFPIVIREALSYGLPIKMHKLETYGTDYDNNPLITFV